MIRRPPRSTLSSSSAASDVYKRQVQTKHHRARLLMRRGRDSREYDLDGLLSQTRDVNDNRDIANDNHKLVSELVGAVLDRNVCVATCGETAAGKSAALLGDGTGSKFFCHLLVDQLFEIAAISGHKYTFEVGAVEVYLDAARDLLLAPSAQQLQVGGRTPRMTTVQLESSEQFNAVLFAAQARRLPVRGRRPGSSQNACTHCIVTLEARREEDGRVTKLTLVDLAGTERPGMDAKEGALNEHRKASKGLVAFTDVVIAHAGRHQHVPYRNSKLTHCLQEALGPQASVLMIMAVHPGDGHYNETMNTLSLAHRIRDAAAARS
eukprot:TRINITY_DN37046_c0_g1_i1.p1 TRINITY_DN37046_c0_g1~~TRINITY_DN37046_c0_g1_i1.p1  ORF type:complete len:322 (+),score=74.90 TRINITY_DN37046_c0_g1_i1:125-1090(+)